MNKEDLAGIDGTSFKIVLNKSFAPSEQTQYIIGCDSYKVEEPLNFWHKILAKMSMSHKTKNVGWEYTVFKLSEIEGKLVGEHINRKG